MSEQNNDRLEEFFQKAAGKADVPFNEADWKKLEARLDAQDGVMAPSRMSVVRWAAAILIVSAVLFSGGVWLNSRYKIVERTPEEISIPMAPDREATNSPGNENLAATKEEEDSPAAVEPSMTNERGHDLSAGLEARSIGDKNNQEIALNNSIKKGEEVADANNVEDVKFMATEPAQVPQETWGDQPRMAAIELRTAYFGPDAIVRLNNEKIRDDLFTGLPAMALKIKQKAAVDLPGAEEGDRREAKANVSAEHASVQKQRLATPRLSLLLSLAPDFSSTSSITNYTRPGTAFGASVLYHFLNRWTVSVGAIKNYKKYSGSGEYYTPPSGYWKRNTNGVVPSTIDGSCSLIEFPVMIRYTALDKGVNRWFVSAGASSYLMQSESYIYNFEEPNPGAKEGWHANRTSPFMFNMINFSVGFEHDVLPGFTLGVEPYVKIPIENIGWPNVKLFSTGASITMRYALFRGQNTSIGRQIPPD